MAEQGAGKDKDKLGVGEQAGGKDKDNDKEKPRKFSLAVSRAISRTKKGSDKRLNPKMSPSSHKPTVRSINENEEPPLGYGVSLCFLKHIVEELKKEFPKENPKTLLDFYTGKDVEVTYETISTSQVCFKFVKPITMKAHEEHPNKLPKQHASYANMLKQLHDNKVPDFRKPGSDAVGVGFPNQFVSHAWAYSFHDLVVALEDHVRGVESVENEDDRKDNRGNVLTYANMFFWVDIFAVDENFNVAHEPAWWKSTFQDAIGDIGATVLVLQPWDDPKPLTRSWCLWEIFSTVVKEAHFHIVMTQSQGTEFMERLETKFGDIMKVLSFIDVAKAEACDPKDQKSIETNVSEGAGFENLNEMVKGKIREWICTQAKESLANMKAALEDAKSDEERKVQQNKMLRLKIRVGDLMMDLDKVDAATTYLEEVLETSEQLWGPWKEQTNNALVVDLIGSLAELVGRHSDKSERKKAGDYYEWALKAGEQLYKSDPVARQQHLRASLAFGTYLQDNNKQGEALKVFQSVKKMCEEEPDAQPDDSALLQAMIGIARGHRLAGALEKALEELDEVEEKLKGRKDKLRLDFLGCKATTLKNLAGKDKEKLKKATELFEQAYEERREVLGEAHLSTIKASHDFAKMLLEEGKDSQAKKCANEARLALEKREGFLTDGSGLLSDIQLTLAKCCEKEGDYAEAEKLAEQVKEYYVANLGATSAKTLNVIGELGYFKCMQGSVKEGKDQMMLARDGLLNTCKLDPNHRWVGKLAKRMEKSYEQSKGKDKGVKVPREIILDCGTNESKVILCTCVEGKPTVVDVGDPLGPMLEYLKDQGHLFVGEVKSRVKQHSVPTFRVGMTAWYRDAKPEDKKSAKKVIEDARKANKQLCETKRLELTHNDEAEYEAIAVDYAARANGLPPTDVLIGSGGGSVQISTNIGLRNQRCFGIEIGFKASQKLLLKEGLAALPKLKEDMERAVDEFVAQTPKYKCKDNANVIAISSCFYASQAASIGETPIQVADVLVKFQEKLASSEEEMAKGNLDERKQKEVTMNLANLTLQVAMFSKLFPSTATIRFRRNWEVNGLPFRTTWTMGWYLKKYKDKLAKVEKGVAAEASKKKEAEQKAEKEAEQKAEKANDKPVSPKSAGAKPASPK